MQGCFLPVLEYLGMAQDLEPDGDGTAPMVPC